jgi:hypothetical protein
MSDSTTIDAGTSDTFDVSPLPFSDFPKADVSALEEYGGALPPPSTPVDPDNYEQQLAEYFGTEADDGAEAKEADDADELGTEAPADKSKAGADAGREAASGSAADFDPQLIDAAVQHFGFTEEEARAFPNPAALHRTLYRMQQALTAARKPDAGDATSAKQGQDGIDADDGLDPEIFPPEIVGTIRDLRRQVAELKGQLQTQVEAPKQEEFCNWFDDQCSTVELPQLGKGRRGELTKAEHQARVELVQLMGSMQGQFPTDTREQLFERAMLARFPKEVQAQKEKQLSSKLRRRAAGAVGNPGRANQSNMNDESSLLGELERERRRMLRANGDL